MMLQNVLENQNSGPRALVLQIFPVGVNQIPIQSVYLANVSQSHVHLDIRFADHEHLHRL